MRTLVMGGAASGKSELAEQLAVKHGGSLLYIATMQPRGREAAERIARHRDLRAGKGFATVERYADLAGLRLAGGETVLLECLGNLAANELFEEGKSIREAQTAICGGVTALERRCGHLVLVSSDVFQDGVSYSPETELYRKLLSGVNAAVAVRCQRVAEVVCGIPIWWKGAGE